MNDASQRPAIGHNLPPDPVDPLIERASELIAAADAWREITDAEQAAKLGDFITQLRDSAGDLERAEDVEKRPHAIALEAIRTRFRRSRDGIHTALQHARRLADGWLNREKHRLALEKAAADLAADRARRDAEAAIVAAQEQGSVSAEIAAREAAEAAEELAEVSEGMATRATIRSELGGRAFSQVTRWSAEIVDAKKAHAFFLKNAEATAAFDAEIVKICRRLAIASKDQAKAPPGNPLRSEDERVMRADAPVMLLKAYPHAFGPGRVHYFDMDDYRTACSLTRERCPGDLVRGVEEEVDCKNCQRAMRKDKAS